MSQRHPSPQPLRICAGAPQHAEVSTSFQQVLQNKKTFNLKPQASYKAEQQPFINDNNDPLPVVYQSPELTLILSQQTGHQGIHAEQSKVHEHPVHLENCSCLRT